MFIYACRRGHFSLGVCVSSQHGTREIGLKKGLIVYNIVRNGSLGSDVVFEKEVTFHEFDFETSELDFEVSKSNI